MTSLKTILQTRNKRIDQQGTPPAIFLNTGDIAVDTDDGGWIINFEEESKTKKFYPFSSINVNNISGSDLNIFVNQRREWQKICRNNSVLRISEFPGVRSVRVSKRDATVTITAGDVEVNVEREALDDDEYRRREVRRTAPTKIISKLLGL